MYQYFNFHIHNFPQPVTLLVKLNTDKKKNSIYLHHWLVIESGGLQRQQQPMSGDKVYTTVTIQCALIKLSLCG